MAGERPERMVLFLGAGSSKGCPSSMPVFAEMMSQILTHLGWVETGVRSRDQDERYWTRGRYRIRPPWSGGIPPEVVFRVLQEGNVEFATPVEHLMGSITPNAVHRVAAALLASSGCVWTPNVDTGIEKAWEQLSGGSPLPRALGAAPDKLHPIAADHKERNFLAAGPGVLVKFHGTADVPGSLAFTDRELLTPPTPASVVHLVELARGAHLVFHGYQAADADLRDLLLQAASVAARTTFFVLTAEQKSAVAEAFGNVPGVRYLPAKILPKEVLLRECSQAFLDLADSCGLAGQVTASDREDLWSPGATASLPISGLRFPEEVNYRLVERFGRPGQVGPALRTALLSDLGHAKNWSPRLALAYFHAVGSYDLYHGGVSAMATRLAIRALRHDRGRRVAALRPARKFRGFVCSRGPALLLEEGRWQDIQALVQYSMTVNMGPDGQPLPVDQYYLGHALRYHGDMDRARQLQVSAEAGFTAAAQSGTDTERLVGPILELGVLDLNQGRFVDAQRRAADLLILRGRYAIQRWGAWGSWLAGAACVYQLRPDEGYRHLAKAETWFADAGDDRQRVDVQIMQLCAARVSIALGLDPKVPVETLVSAGASTAMTARQREDIALVRADLALGEGRCDLARTLIAPMLSVPATVIGGLWARLVDAEITRREGGLASAAFTDIAARAAASGATWLQLQALAGLVRCGNVAAARDWDAAASDTQIACREKLRGLTCSERPLLWAVT